MAEDAPNLNLLDEDSGQEEATGQHQDGGEDGPKQKVLHPTKKSR